MAYSDASQNGVNICCCTGCFSACCRAQRIRQLRSLRQPTGNSAGESAESEQKLDPQADAIASRYRNSDYDVGRRRGDVGRGLSVLHVSRDGAEAYRAPSACGIFPRRSGAAGKDVPLILVKGEREMPRAGRAERFASKITDNLVVIDPESVCAGRH